MADADAAGVAGRIAITVGDGVGAGQGDQIGAGQGDRVIRVGCIRMDEGTSLVEADRAGSADIDREGDCAAFTADTAFDLVAFTW